MLKYVLILFIAVGSSAFCNSLDLDQAKETAQEKIESGFEKTALGAIEVAIGVLYATKGDVAVSAGVAAHGLKNIKDGLIEK